MAIKIGGVEPTDITYNGSQANYATLNGTIVWQRVSAVAFTVADTGASFSVSTTTVSWTGISQGTLVGSPTYSNGQNLGSVTTDTNRTQVFTVTVPNDPNVWTNYGQNITFSLSDIQEATVYYPPIISGLVFTQSTTTATTGHASWQVNLQGYTQIGQTRVYYNGVQTTTTGTTANIYNLNPGTTESLTIEVDTSQGTGSATTSTYFQDTFDFDDGYVDGSFAISSGGIPSATLQGGATNLSFALASYDVSCTSVPRTNTIYFTAPSGYHNSGDTESGDATATQPGYGQPAGAAALAVVTGNLTNIPASGGSGTHSVTLTSPAGVGEWNIVYSGFGITPPDRSGCGDRTSVTWDLAANTGPARSGTIKIYAGASQTTLLDTLSWNQLAGVTSYSHSYTKATSSANACSGVGSSVTVYAASSTDPIVNSGQIFSNSAMTNSAPSGWYSDGGSVGYWSGGSWSNQGLCGIGGGI